MERVLRKRRAGGGERVMSGTGAGAVGGALNKESGRNVWTDMRERRLVCDEFAFGGGSAVEERSSASWPEAPGADISRFLVARHQMRLGTNTKEPRIVRLTPLDTSASHAGSRTR